MIKQGFGVVEKENEIASTPYRLGVVFLIIMAVGMIVTAVWREINQLTSNTILDELPISNTPLLLVPMIILVGMSMLIGWHLMGQKSFDNNWRIQKYIATLFWGLAVAILIVISFYGVWSISDWNITIWSLPSLSSMVLFGYICLLLLQLERIKSGVRQWGFLTSGFDLRDTINISVISFFVFWSIPSGG